MVFVVNTDNDPWDIYCNSPPEFIQHAENVGMYSKYLYQIALHSGLFDGGLSEMQLLHIQNAVIYHDIGKSVYEPAFLHQSCRFNSLERKFMSWHVEFGLMLFQKTMELKHSTPDTQIFLHTVYDSIAHHHEWFNGVGYPKGLRSTQISPVGQICAICDCYDALRSRRSYHKAMTHARTIEKIFAERGTHFNPQLVDLLMDHEQAFKQLKRWEEKDTQQHNPPRTAFIQHIVNN